MGKKTGRRYPPEFKQEAIRLVQASDEKNPVPKIARNLGVCTETLRKWANPRPRSMQEETEKDSPQKSRKNCATCCAKR